MNSNQSSWSGSNGVNPSPVCKRGQFPDQSQFLNHWQGEPSLCVVNEVNEGAECRGRNISAVLVTDTSQGTYANEDGENLLKQYTTWYTYKTPLSKWVSRMEIRVWTMKGLSFKSRCKNTWYSFTRKQFSSKNDPTALSRLLDHMMGCEQRLSSRQTKY